MIDIPKYKWFTGDLLTAKELIIKTFEDRDTQSTICEIVTNSGIETSEFPYLIWDNLIKDRVLKLYNCVECEVCGEYHNAYELSLENIEKGDKK